VIAVQMRRARVKVQRVENGSGVFSLILHLFALDSAGIHVVDRG
jgi:hypothetical protein